MVKYSKTVDLNNKVVVITGGAGAICSCFAKALSEVGAKVAIVDISLENAEKVAKEIGKGSRGYFANVLDINSLNECYNKVKADFGEVDILINGAGGNHPSATTDNEYYNKGDVFRDDIKTFFSLKEEGIKRIFDINFTGILMTTQVFAKGMAERGGNIINIASMNAFHPLTKIPAYSAAKAAVTNFTEWLSVHFAEAGIRVNAIAPGFFVGNQNRALLFDDKGNLTKRSLKIISHTPMGRFGEFEDLVGALYFLCDDNFSRFVTGVILPVDGGFNAYSGV